jgi:U2 small nuclear ribonucleoprotein A'
MRITAELISKSNQYLNAVGEFHLDLRGNYSLQFYCSVITVGIGYKIPFIENLVSTKDQFGTIDMTDNEITTIPILPPLARLKTLILSENRISSIDPAFCKNLPGIENLVLINNKVSIHVC